MFYVFLLQGKKFAPRPWRCFSPSWESEVSLEVCSTPVEMFLEKYIYNKKESSLLHARGDVSSSSTMHLITKRFAPRPWRCFPKLIKERTFRKVCSTPVEMFPNYDRGALRPRCLLHARGDVSPLYRERSLINAFAPRPWRCFHKNAEAHQLLYVCSTPVEMFLAVYHLLPSRSRLLHARGDVSEDYWLLSSK